MVAAEVFQGISSNINLVAGERVRVPEIGLKSCRKNTTLE